MKKNLIKVTIILSMLLLTLIPLSVSAMSGNGTEESPFLITSQEDLELITDFPSSNFRLVNNIVMNGNIKSLCYESENRTFTGVFDGNGYTISNITMTSTDTDYYSLSLFYKNGGTIKNLNLIISDFSSALNAAGITINNKGIISNCTVAGEIEGLEYVGGIAEYNSGIIEKCKVKANLNGRYSETAGICVNNHSEIKDCYYMGTLIGSSTAGISSSNSGTIKNCYVVANFNDSTNMYPIAKSGTVENCYYDKTVSGLNNTTYGTPKSTTAMKMIQTYQANWDFDTVWGIDSNINDGYPYLLWEYAPTDNQIAFDSETQIAKIYLKEAGTYTVIFADYDGAMFNEADIQPLTLKQGYNSIPTTLTLTNGDKVFLWKDLKTLVPICEALEFSSK